MTSKSHYDEKYFEWQAHVGEFGALANKIKFEKIIKPNSIKLLLSIFSIKY